MSLEKKLDNIKSMEDLFSLTIEVAKSSTNVATLAYVESWNNSSLGDFYEVIVKPFPLKQEQDEYSITCYCNKDIAKDLTAEDIVIVLYTDLDFRSSLNDKSINPVNNEECHTINSGVIIGYLTKQKK